ncbi:MAG: hypothetical protein ACRD1V_21300 [Vicinamibacterales bacterium]
MPHSFASLFVPLTVLISLALECAVAFGIVYFAARLAVRHELRAAQESPRQT